MGNSNSQYSYQSYSLLNLYLVLDREYYVSGQQVQGTVYLELKRNINSSSLRIQIQGLQYISWSTRQQDKQVSHQKCEQTYKHDFTLYEFKEGLSTGQYIFPFSFTLPTMIPGSFKKSNDCCIEYTCSAKIYFDQSKTFDEKKIFLNILEPPRSPMKSLSDQRVTHSRCCLIFEDYGTTVVTLQCNKNFILNDEPFMVKGSIDHTDGRVPIEEVEILIQEYTEMKKDLQKRNQFRLFSLRDNRIQNGSIYRFSEQFRLPKDFQGYSSYGKFVTRFYRIHLTTRYGWCNNRANGELHIFIHSKTPQMRKNLQTPNFSQWKPQKFVRVIEKKTPVFRYNSSNLFRNQQKGLVDINKYLNYQPVYGEYVAPLSQKPERKKKSIMEEQLDGVPPRYIDKDFDDQAPGESYNDFYKKQ